MGGNKDIFQFGRVVGLADVEKYPYFRQDNFIPNFQLFFPLKFPAFFDLNHGRRQE